MNSGKAFPPCKEKCAVRPLHLLIPLMPFLALWAQADTFHVPADFPTIQGAIDRASDGDTVLVDPGTYVENIDFKGKDILVTSTGGAAATVIDGNQSGSVALFTHQEGPDAVLEGFTLTNGSGTLGSYDYVGGAIFCYAAAPTLRRNILSGNTAYNGGAVFCQGYDPLILDNIIRNNHASGMYGYGGGIYCMGGHATIQGNLIADNIASEKSGGIYCHGTVCCIADNEIRDNEANGTFGDGGGICLFDCHGRVSCNVIHHNYANFQGGGIRCLGNTLKFQGNLIYRNISAVEGGGIYCSFTDLYVTNNTLFGNKSLYGGGGILCADDSHMFVTNTILWNNEGNIGPEIWIEPLKWGASLAISHSDVKGGKDKVVVDPGGQLNWGPGMLDADPLFADSGSDDFHLLIPSPCLEAGDDGAPALPKTDFEGDPMRVYGVPDIGGDEFYPHLYHTGDTTPGGAVTIKLIGLPGSTPVGFWIGSGVLDPPLPSIFGDWHLAFPVIGPILLPPIPGNGLQALSSYLPGSPPGPYSVPLQAMVGSVLTNLEMMRVE
jgi:hypothetical protein